MIFIFRLADKFGPDPAWPPDAVHPIERLLSVAALPLKRIALKECRDAGVVDTVHVDRFPVKLFKCCAERVKVCLGRVVEIYGDIDIVDG